SWRGPLLLGLGSAGPSGADPSPDQLLARPHAILFDAAAFEPLADGEPDLSPFAPEPEGFESLASDTPRLALVQFAAPPGPAQRAALAEMGVEPLFAVPREAYLVRADAVALGRAAGLSGVRWVGRFRPGYKFDRRLARAAAGRPAPSPLPGEGLDAFRVHALALPGPGRSAADLAAAVAAADPSVLVEGASSDGTVALLALSVPRIRLREALARLAALEEVVALEPRGEVAFHNDDAVWIGQSYDRFWKRNYSKSATVWKRGLLGDGELIGIADSGVDPDVCWMIDDPKGLPPVSSVPADGALAGPIPVDLTRRKIVAYNLLGSFQAQATAYDVRSGDPHGTWTAVSVAGDDPTNPATESNPLGPHHDAGDGVAPMAKLVVEDLGDDQGNLVGLGLPIPLMVDRMFEQMRDAGARISTNSWGISHNEYDTLAFFTDRMVWNHPDFLIVFSAGNSGPFAGSLASPGTAKNVLTVGASDSRIQADPDPTKALDPENVAEFSSRGPTSDGRLKPDIMMSGRSLVTGTSDRRELGRTCSTLEVNGTSFAAPLVAGYAALAREYFRKGFYPSGAARAADALTPSAALLKATLLAGARNMTGRGGADYGPCVPDTCDLTVGLCFNGFGACSEDADCWTCSGKSALTCAGDRDCNLALLQDDAPTPEQGWGRLQLDDALYFSGDTRGLALWDVPRDRGVATGESWSSEVYLDGRAEELKIVLTWPDPPALVASPSYLVNDLDLVVTAPNGTTYRGNAWAARDRNPVTREATAPNAPPVSDNDNVEMVRLPAGGAPPGVWRIEVVGESVPGTPLVDGSARQDFAIVAVGPVASAGGTLRFVRPRFGCDGTAELEALDIDAGATIQVSVTTSSGDEESTTLAALGGGRFAGGVALTSGQPIVPGNGRLELANGDELTAVYQDASPAHAATARASAGCGQPLVAGPALFAGGCDGDDILDAGETGSLSLSLVNPGPADLRGVTGVLRSTDPRLFVPSGTGTFGDIAVGAAATVATPFVVSLRDGVPRSTAVLELEVRAEGWTVPRLVPVTLEIETDVTTTEGTWTEALTVAPGECYDGDPAPTLGSWYWFDVNRNCSTS
ncbi:MAG: S8 family serine peptidase, partial [Acidobacteria bacterium]|nr:S8 family serine peptidase [Acidobacteriota bacterium]